MKKNILLLFVLALLAGFSSCSDSEDNTEPPFVWEGDIPDYNPLVGVWQGVNNPVMGLEFTSGKTLYSLTFHSGQIIRREAERTYQINEKAYRENNIHNTIIRYELNGDNLTTYPYGERNEWVKVQ